MAPKVSFSVGNDLSKRRQGKDHSASYRKKVLSKLAVKVYLFHP